MAASGYDRTKAVKEFDDSKIGVKGLSDSGITSIPAFFVHPPESLSDLKSSNTTTASIPVIDLSYVTSPTHRPKIVEQIKQEAKTWGFFQVINHGVPSAALDETISSFKAFHDLPQTIKAKYYKRDEQRGVAYYTNNDLHRANAATWHDALQAWVGPELPAAEEIPEICRKEVVSWNSHATGVAETLMELLCEGLGLEAGKFKELSFLERRLIVGLCYPYCPQPDLTVGLTPHTDPNVITVLLQNHVPGLQVKHGDVWVDVKPVLGGLIVNVGDFLQIISNGEYTSIQHRVLANSYKEPRISVVTFFSLNKWKADADGNSYHGPLPELLTPETPPIYRDFTAHEYLENFSSKGLDSKSFIQKVKIQN